MKNRLANTALFICATLVTPLLVAIGVNLPMFDEELNPYTSRLLQASSEATVAKKTPDAVQQNAYYWLLGLNAKATQDPIALAQEMVAPFLVAPHAGPANVRVAAAEALDESWQAEFDALSCSARTDPNCRSKLRDELAQKSISHPRARLLLDRYQGFIAQTNVHFTAPLPSSIHKPEVDYSLPLSLQKLFLAESFIQDSDERFLQKLSNDIHFWKMMLRESDSVIAKMVASRALYTAMQTLSDKFQGRHSVDDHIASLALAALAPLSDSERNIEEAFDHETLWFNESCAKMPWYLKLFKQDQATLNYYNERFTAPMKKLAQLDANSFSAKQNDCASSNKSTTFYCLTENRAPSFSLTRIYNIAGEQAADFSEFDMHEYIARVHDVANRFELGKLQMELIKNGKIEAASVTKNSPYKNLNTGKTFDLSSDYRLISFECLSDSYECQIAL